MLALPTLASLFSLFTYKFLQYLIGVYTARKVRVGRPALTAKESLESDIDVEQKKKFDARDRQKRALQDFFRDTGGKITDLRVLRSAMFLSDEIDRAVRGIDVEGQYVGWRPYNRFYAEGTEDLFTNVPTGRSPLVMAAPRTGTGGELQELNKNAPSPIEYQAVRRSHLQQVGRSMDEIEQSELNRISGGIARTNLNRTTEQDLEQRYQNADIRPVNDDFEPKRSTDLRVGAYQRYDPIGQGSTKQRLFKFEGEMSERRPDLDYKFE